MKLNSIVYFYYDNFVPCVKGRLGVGFEDAGKKYFTISHLNNDNKPIGTSIAPADHIFDTQAACMDYAESMGAFDEPAPTVCRCGECVYHEKRCSGLVKLDTGAFWTAGGCMNGVRKERRGK